jgi:hypothetical protein
MLDAARAFRAAAGEPDRVELVPAALTNLEQAVEALSAGCYQLARAAPPSSEQLVHVIALHDVAVSFDRCARACRDAQSTVASVIARRATAQAGRAG